MGSDRADELAVTAGWPDGAIGQLAARQRTLITRRQLRALGVSGSAISRATARGRLHRVHRGVYSLVPASVRPPLAAEQAAILAYGDGAVLSHYTAARIHGIWRAGDGAAVHVTLVAKLGSATHAGITLHTTLSLHPQEHHRLHGLPVTSVARTAIDLSPGLTARARERLVDEALKKTSRTKLRECLARHPGRAGAPAIAALLDPDRPSSLTWSQGEERLRELIRRVGLPAPESNIELYNGYFPDLLWRQQRLIVEYDSLEHHSGPGAFTNDRTRHNTLEADGYRVLHVTADQLTHERETVLVWIVRALAQAGG